MILLSVMEKYIVWFTCYLASSYLKVKIKSLMASFYFVKHYFVMVNATETGTKKLPVL